MANIKIDHEIEMFCDLHTHSERPNSFIYGCPLPILQTFALWSKTHLLPKMMAKLTNLFSYRDCIFTIHPSKVRIESTIEKYCTINYLEKI